MSRDLLESHVTEPSERFIEEVNSHNNTLKNNKIIHRQTDNKILKYGYMCAFLYFILKHRGESKAQWLQHKGAHGSV